MGIKGCNQHFGFLGTSLILATSLFSQVHAQTWQPLGPGPLLLGQSENIPNTPVIGAIHGIATHPSNADIVYVAAVNGGIWMTSNATAASPTWVAQTDDQPSMSMSDVEFDATDATAQTLVAGSGRFSSLGGIGGSRAGIMRTTDGGNTWTQLDGGMDGRNITSVEARGSILLASVNTADTFTCANIGVFRSSDTGANWTQLDATNNGLPRGASTALTADPSDNAIFYASIHNFNNACSTTTSGIYKTVDTGANWSKVSNASMDTLITASNCHTEIAVGNNDNVFVAMVCTGGSLDAVFSSSNGGSNWTTMDLPETTEGGGNVIGIHPGGQGGLHTSLAADPITDTVIYIGGDRQPGEFGFPTANGANNFSGRLFRGDASQASGSQWTPITHSGTASNSAPHADSRDLAFDANNSLLEADDGGIYRQTSAGTATGDWISVNGNMAINEQHDTVYDNNSAIVISGNQDNGSSHQQSFASTTWQNFGSGDGGDVVVDTLSLAGSNQSVRYQSSQNLQGIRRLVYDANNNFISQTGLALNVTSGNPLSAQFVTPLAINNINGNRLIVGAGNSVYESLDQGDTVSEIGIGIAALGTGRNTIAYGATGNEDILYVGGCMNSCFDDNSGTEPDGIFVRTTAAGALSHVFTPNSGIIEGVAINPENPTEAFAITGTSVFRTTDSGANWADITSTLTGFGQLRSIIFMSDATDSGLAVGGNTGVFLSRQSGNYINWVTPASGIPNTPVFELSYDAATSRLIAGTMGRGAFALTGILSGNTPPVANADAIMVSKGGVVTTLLGGSNTLLNNDTDPDAGDNLTVETTPTTQPINGLITLATDGTFSYQHSNSFTSSDQFFYRVCDDGTPQFCSDGQVDVTIDLGSSICSNPNIIIPDGGGPNNPATDTLVVTDTGSITDLNVAIEIDHTWVGDLAVTLTHTDSGTTVSLIEDPVSGNCQEDDISVTLDDEATGNVDDQCATSGVAISGTFQPSNPLSGFDGEDLAGNWTLTISDSFGQDSGALISWCLDPTVDNTAAAPVLDGVGNQNVDELNTLNFTATATDTDTTQANLVFSLSGEPAGASMSSNGLFSFTPTEAQGPNSYTFDVIVTDDSAPVQMDSETITVTVAEINVNPVLDAIGNQNIDELNTLAFTATATDADEPSQNLSFSLSGQPTGASISATGDFSFTPSAAQGPNTYTFDVIVTDDGTGNLTDSETINVTVNDASNQAPVLSSIGNQTIDELNTLSFTATATDSDDPAQNLSFSLSGQPNGANITTGGAFSFTPSEVQGPNTYTFDVIVTDDGTGDLSDSETITVTVNEDNQPPVLSTIGNQTVEELATLSFTAIATDPDQPAQNLTFSLSGQPTGASITTNGNFSFTPIASQGPNSYTFDVIVTDDGPGTLSDSQTITVQVTDSNANENPVLTAIGNQTVDELSNLSFTATATDADDPAQNLTFSLSGQPTGASITTGGNFSFTPTEAQGPNNYSFDVIVTDDGPGNLSDSETITVTVNENNQPPVLSTIGNQNIDELNTLSFTASATDSDVPTQILTFSLSGAPSDAVITSDGDFSFTPTELQGPNSFTFDVVVTDSGSGNLSDSETITINVAELNESPVLDAIGNQVVDELTTLNFTATASDPDFPSQNLTYSLSGQPTGATITANGQFSFTPTVAQSPNDYTFDVIVSDGQFSDIETITVTVIDVIFRNGFE